MTFHPSISNEYRPLIRILRCALNGLPPDNGTFRSVDWSILFRQAQQHGVDMFLYPWLAIQLPNLFSAHASVSDQSIPSVWRVFFLNSLPRLLQRQRQLEEILATFEKSRVSVVPLKGAWLSEAVYDDPAQRTMCDLDLLVHSSDVDRCHSLLLALGYFIREDLRHNAYACDQTYYHHSHRWFVELHWTFASNMDTRLSKPDIDAVWCNTSETELWGHPVHVLSHEDQLAHLVQHILHHHFTIPIRGYLDIAVCLKRFGQKLQPAVLDSAANRWKIGRSIPFVLKLVSDLFDIKTPDELKRSSLIVTAEQYTRVFNILFDLPETRDRDGEMTLLRFQQASPVGRLKLVLARIFMPRAFLIPTYPYARHFYGLPIAWFCRAMRLIRNNRRKIKRMNDPSSSAAKALANADTRMRMVETLLQETKKPE